MVGMQYLGKFQSICKAIEQIYWSLSNVCNVLLIRKFTKKFRCFCRDRRIKFWKQANRLIKIYKKENL